MDIIINTSNQYNKAQNFSHGATMRSTLMMTDEATRNNSI